MSEGYATKAELAAHRWLLEQLFTNLYRGMSNPAAAARDYAKYAEEHWSEMAQHSLGHENPDLFFHINSAGSEVTDILNSLADDFEAAEPT